MKSAAFMNTTSTSSSSSSSSSTSTSSTTNSIGRRKALLVFLHGSGGNGSETRAFLERAPLAAIRFKSFGDAILRASPSTAPFSIYSVDLLTPTATLKRFTPAAGQLMNIWYDRPMDFMRKGVESEEDVSGINASLNLLIEVIKARDRDEKIDNLIVAGFSMGGGMALHFLRDDVLQRCNMQGKLTGVFTMGSFLTNQSPIWAEAKAKRVATDVPVLMMHGTRDTLINIEWGRATATQFTLHDANLRFETYEGVGHEITEEMLLEAIDFIVDSLNAQIKEEEVNRWTQKKLNDLAYKVANSSISGEEERGMEVEEGEEGESSSSNSNSNNSNSNTHVFTSSIPSNSNSNNSESSSNSSSSTPTRQIHRLEKQLPFYFDRMGPVGVGGGGASFTEAYRIYFIATPELVPVLVNRPVLANGAAFDIVPDSSNSSLVSCVARTPSPLHTAQEISKRLFIRIQSDSASVNPCPVN